MPNTITWVAGTQNSDWTIADNWVGDIEPTAANDVSIGSTSGDSATIDTGQSVAADNVTLGSPAGGFGDLAIVGTLNLGGTLTLDPNGELFVGALVSPSRYGGVIDGGTIDFAGGGLSLTGPQLVNNVAEPGATLEAVTLAGTASSYTLPIGTGGAAAIIDGLTSNFATLNLADQVTLDFVGNQTFSGTTIENALNTTGDGTLTLAAGLVLTGEFRFASNQHGAATLVNKGLIEANDFVTIPNFVGGGAIEFNANLINDGTIEHGATVSGSFTNAGTFTLATGADATTATSTTATLDNSGTLHIVADSTFDIDPDFFFGGTVPVNSNAGGTIVIDSGGTLINGAVLSGGVIGSSGGTIDGNGGTLNDIEIAGVVAVIGDLSIAGTTQFVGATVGAPGSVDLGGALTYQSEAAIGNVTVTFAPTLGGGDDAFYGDAGVTLEASSNVNFTQPAGNAETIFAETSLTLAGTIGAFAGGTLDLTAEAGNITNSGTLLTASGEELVITARSGSLAVSGDVMLASGSVLKLATNLSAAAFDAINNQGGSILLEGTLAGDGLVGDSTATLPLGSTFSTGPGSYIKDVTIDANGAVGFLSTTLDGVTWQGVPLNVSNAGETDVLNGLTVRTANGNPGTIFIGGSNSILQLDDNETLDNVTVDIGQTLDNPGTDSFALLQGADTSLTIGASAVFNLSGNDAINGIGGFATIDVDGTLDMGGTIEAQGDLASAGNGNASAIQSDLKGLNETMAQYQAQEALNREILDQKLIDLNNRMMNDEMQETMRLEIGRTAVVNDVPTTDVSGPDYDNPVSWSDTIDGTLQSLFKFDPISSSSSSSGLVAETTGSGHDSSIVSPSVIKADEATIDGNGTIDIGPFGYLDLDAVVASGVDVAFTSPYGIVLLFDPSAMAGAISGFGPGDVIDLALDGYTGGAPTYAGNQLTIPTASGSVTLTLTFATGVSVANVSTTDDTFGGTAIYMACFADGTRIATDRGEMPVETLRPGDRVRTASGEIREIIWTGHRRIGPPRHPQPRTVQPIRVSAHAFGPGAPCADIRLSPDHAVYFSGVLIPIRCLVNGVSVVQEEVDAVSYWHVELDAHDIILAEGLPCESYLDTGNRDAFTGECGPRALFPDFATMRREAEGCCELFVHGAPVDAARALLASRAAALPAPASPAALRHSRISHQ